MKLISFALLFDRNQRSDYRSILYSHRIPFYPCTSVSYSSSTPTIRYWTSNRKIRSLDDSSS